MTFQVPESKRSIGQNRFHATLPDGTEFSLPKAKYLTMGQIEKLSGQATEVTLHDILDLFGDEDAATDAIRTLDHEQVAALMQAWQADSGLTVGESSASE
ncbi:tail assembly chaperone [Microbacterium phage Armstrong]|uniref:Tail assembly chaperone n=4 Tax=Armstrongvirus armstrong TaxID=2734217 RepID=A0A3G2KD59_9CAUD|nr:tail assembly chaperone [Microbacterium phage Armstrong]AYN57046.1 tail assembly chaperone [Microbacterium phage Bernstein]AYN58993.1 tail assembly chaperone [Microbacterium phage Rollins]QED11435.1 tail assembly chaperone [Microbacterium phage Vitas]UGL61979.1 tail assembly chaperone [Microbacterium phage Skylord]UOK18165.1 tail assembly chaperone [Microbacterium phage Clayda5]